jgi:putative transposase
MPPLLLDLCQAGIEVDFTRVHRHGAPEAITLDGSETNAAAIGSYNDAYGTAIIIR